MKVMLYSVKVKLELDSILFSGLIELSKTDYGNEVGEEKFLILDEFSYFGETALLQEGNPRSATRIAKTHVS